jgi:hypothetical protein
MPEKYYPVAHPLGVSHRVVFFTVPNKKNTPNPRNIPHFFSTPLLHIAGLIQTC